MKTKRVYRKSQGSRAVNFGPLRNVTTEFREWYFQSYGVFRVFAGMGWGKTALLILLAELERQWGKRKVCWMDCPDEAQAILKETGLDFIVPIVSADLKDHEHAVILNDEALITQNPYAWNSKEQKLMGADAALFRQRFQLLVTVSQRLRDSIHLRDLSYVTGYKHLTTRQCRKDDVLRDFLHIVPKLKIDEMLVIGEEKGFETTGIVRLGLPACWEEHGEKISHLFAKTDVSKLKTSEYDRIYGTYEQIAHLDPFSVMAKWEVMKLTGCSKTLANSVVTYARDVRAAGGDVSGEDDEYSDIDVLKTWISMKGSGSKLAEALYGDKKEYHAANKRVMRAVRALLGQLSISEQVSEDETCN